MTAASIITVPAALTSPQIAIMIVLAVISLVCIGAMAYAIRTTSHSFQPQERRQLLMIAAVVAGIGYMLIDNRADPYIAPLDRALITTPPEQITPITLTVDIATACPPQDEGMTSQIIMTIETRSDLEPLVTGCNRIADRAYVVNAEPRP